METKFFRIAKAGSTIDGREIKPQQLAEIAETYDPKLYGARIWIEHLRSWLPNSDFKALGDVTEVKTETNKDGTFLLAKLKPTSDFLKLNEAKQKIYTSIEMMTDFANTGKAYLVGLAVTDSPASLGTEAIQFSKNQPQAENLISSFLETNLEIEAEKQSLFSRIFNFEKEKMQKPEQGGEETRRVQSRDGGHIGENYTTPAQKIQDLTNKNNNNKNQPQEEIMQEEEKKEVAKVEASASDSQLIKDIFSELKNLKDELLKQSNEFKQAQADNLELYNKLKSTSDKQAREIADNSNGAILTDC